jgi:hypothetical protein
MELTATPVRANAFTIHGYESVPVLLGPELSSPKGNSNLAEGEAFTIHGYESVPVTLGRS